MHYSRTQRIQRNRKPFSFFVTQDFSNWLKWLIPQSKNLIEDWKLSITTTRNTIYNYQQSPAWDALYPKCEHAKSSTALQLAFSLFVDWLNPLSNKTSGKQVFLGVLALNCLNLPPTSLWKEENTFIYGLVPEPSQPNMITIKNILRIFIEEMVQLNSGIFIQTPHYPKGHKVVVRFGCLIGDLVANQKVLGFAFHSATWFCSWCECPKAEIQQIKLAKL
ncbi:hypothetical protein O181_035809 [Austropuccinia psidii MF-1]|uniref:Uncharacterized protein n=1 Tax=Austropuccinia psidii MF-1 TaxID=1389203 RepID=A0A9Q3D3G2_9BASI|nr:hypothetical protein [Austropuccinia psidii MF-1]